MKNNAKTILEYTQQELKSLIFRYTHKTSPRHFTRSSILGFESTALLILHMIKKSIKVELMDYFYQKSKEIEIPSRQAFTQAREKISYLAFKDFFEKSCELAVKSEDAKLYKGYRLFAIDGTSFVVGMLNKLSEYFGQSTSIKGKAMCRISGVVDVCNDCMVNADVSPYSVGERALAIGQIEELKTVSNALFLFDRGYWSPELVGGIIKNGQKFLMRLASNNGKASVTDESGNDLTLRCYSFILPGGEKETLLTNISEEEMPDEELADLYAKRWGVETKYLELKDRLQIDKLSGESVNIVLQDIYSTLYISNLVAFICYEADEAVRERTTGKGNKYEQKTNRSTCISAIRKRFIDICLLDDPVILDAALERLFNDISKDVTYINKSKPKPRNKRLIKEARRSNFKAVL